MEANLALKKLMDELSDMRNQLDVREHECAGLRRDVRSLEADLDRAKTTVTNFKPTP